MSATGMFLCGFIAGCIWQVNICVLDSVCARTVLCVTQMEMSALHLIL